MPTEAVICAQFLIRTSIRHLNSQLRLLSDSEEQIDLLVVPHRIAPVIVNSPAGLALKPMRYGLLPSWSKEPKLKFSTHNARLDAVITKPTWKVPFAKQHCLVPVSDFIEPIYGDNEFAGHMVQFFEENKTLLFAAGIYDQWLDRKTGETIESFAIITTEPAPFVKKVGHDLSPLFLNTEGATTWLKEQKTPAQWLEFLQSNTRIYNFAAEKLRPLKNTKKTNQASQKQTNLL